MEQKLSRNELFSLLVLLCHGGYFWVLPSFVTKENGSMGIVSMIFGAGIGFLLLVIAYRLSKAAAGEHVFLYFQQIMPKPLGQLIGLMIWFYLVIFLILCLAFFTEMMSSRLLLQTPRWVITGVLLLPIGWLVEHGLADIARFSIFAFSSLMLLMVMLILGNLPLFELIQALPFTMANSDAFLANTIQVGNAYGIVLCMMFIFPRAAKETKSLHWASGGLFLAVFFLSLMTFLAMGVFGQDFSQSMFWMHLEQAKVIRLGPYLERVEVFYVILWMSVIFASSAILIYCTNHSLMQIVHRPLTRRMHWVLIFLFWLCCNFLETMTKMISLMQYFNQIFFWLMMGGILFALFFERLAQYRQKR